MRAFGVEDMEETLPNKKDRSIIDVYTTDEIPIASTVSSRESSTLDSTCNNSTFGYMRPLQRPPSDSADVPAPGHYDVLGSFSTHSNSRMRNSISHSIRSKDGWEKVIISKHHTQERKGIGTPGVGEYTKSSRHAKSCRSAVIRASMSPHGLSPRTRSWFPFQSFKTAPSPKLGVVGVSFPKASRDLQLKVTTVALPVDPVSSSRSTHVNRDHHTATKLSYKVPSPEKSTPVSGLFMPVFARNSRSVSFTRAGRNWNGSLSPRYSPWSPNDCSQSSWRTGRGAPKFGSPRTSPRLDFRLMIN